MEAHAPNDDQFRSMEKRIKRFCKDLTADHSKLSKRQKLKLEQQCPPSDFTWEEVIDVLNLSDAQRNSLKTNYQPASIIGCTAAHDLSSISRGLFLLSQALTPEQQLFWAAKAVEEYSTAEHNNITNLSSLYGQNNNLSEDNSTLNENGGDNSCTNKEESNSQNISSVENLWSDSRSEKEPFQTFAKLRWSCLGYHYDWTKRMYQKDLKSFFPTDLSSLCSSLAAAVGQELNPEAGIVNYYPTGTNMGGHLDDAELTMEHPIISISLGLSAIFLIGGRSRMDKPTPLLLRSGDVLVMSGESRYCYHGIPVILPADFQPPIAGAQSSIVSLGKVGAAADACVSASKGDRSMSCTWRRLAEAAERSASPERMGSVVRYLQQARINMNVRQVRPSSMGEEEWVVKCGTGAAASTGGSATVDDLLTDYH